MSATFKFGVITDIQHADVDDGKSFDGTETRRYRHALRVAERAFSTWHAAGDVRLVLQLGDIIDGKTSTKKAAREALKRVIHAWERPWSEQEPEGSDGASSISGEEPDDYFTVVSCYGNHCSYVLPRSVVLNALHVPPRGHAPQTPELHPAYFSYPLCPRWRLVVLDSYDISVLAWPPDSARSKTALELLRQHNSNDDVNSPVGLVGLDERWCAFNGAVGSTQLRWLAETLQSATAEGENVIIATHVPFHPDCTKPICLLWNYDDVLAIVHEHGAACVRACFYGHDHFGGQSVDERGIAHHVFEGALIADVDQLCHADVTLSDSSITIAGSGLAESRTITWDADRTGGQE